jgi:hypothetical protein
MSNKAKQMAKSERAASSRYIADTHEQILREAQGLVKAAAMAIRWSRVSAHQNVFLHVMLDDLDGRRLLNWWPRKEAIGALDGSRGECPDIDTAVWLADMKRSSNK